MGKKPEVYELYEHIADWFDSVRNRDLIEKEYLNIVSSNLKENAQILDLGCGAGEPLAKFFIEKGHHVTGVDGSSNMLAMCIRRFPEMEWIRGDMRTISLKRKFDAIIAWDSFFHLSHKDQRDMFQIFHDHINVGGVLVFTSGPEYGEVYSNMEGHEFYHASLDAQEYIELLNKYGFEVLIHKIEDPDCGEHTVWVAKCLKKH